MIGNQFISKNCKQIYNLTNLVLQTAGTTYIILLYRLV